MTQAEREQKAREWLEKTGQVYWKGHDVAVSKTDLANVVELLADIERAVLKDVAETHLIGCAFLNNDEDDVEVACSCDIEEFRRELQQQAKEVQS